MVTTATIITVLFLIVAAAGLYLAIKSKAVTGTSTVSTPAPTAGKPTAGSGNEKPN